MRVEHCLKTRKMEGGGYASEIKKGTYLFQPISLLSAPKVKELVQLLDGRCLWYQNTILADLNAKMLERILKN